MDFDAVLGQSLAAISQRDLVREHRADGAISVPKVVSELNRRALLDSRAAELDQLVIDLALDAVVLRAAVVARDRPVYGGIEEHLAEVEALALVMVDCLANV